MNSLSSLRSRAASAPQARRISRTLAVSMIASSRCSTVMNSWRASRADWNASFRQISSSLLSTGALSTFASANYYLCLDPAVCDRVQISDKWGRSCLLHRAQQGVLVLACVRGHLSHLGLGDLVREHTANAFASGVNLEHDSRCSRAIHAEDAFEHVDHELHGSVVIVQQHDLIE